MISPEPERILFIRLKAIGDVVLCTPLVRALRKAYPRAQIDFLADSAPAQLIQKNPHLTQVLTAPARGSAFSVYWDFLKKLRAAHYDLVFDLFGNPRSAWITRWTGARTRAGYAYRVRKWAYTHPVPMNRQRKYQVDVNLGVLSHLGIPDDGIHTEIILDEAEKNQGEALFEGWGLGKGKGLRVGLNPTGTWSAKRWPIQYWRDLILLLAETSVEKPILLTGPGDAEILGTLTRGLEAKIRMAPPTNLRQLAGVIGRLDLIIGNDGAPQHIAQALGVKSLTLFGPTWGVSWNKPDDPRHLFLQDAPPCGPCDQTVCPNSKEQVQG
ncbi:MAG: glycosyltransferase family 9 protein, partial [bacterium]